MKTLAIKLEDSRILLELLKGMIAMPKLGPTRYATKNGRLFFTPIPGTEHGVEVSIYIDIEEET